MAMAVDSQTEVAKPKRAASAYFLFGNSVRDGLMEENKKANGGKAKVAEVAKRIGELWKELGEKEKAKFEEQAKEGKEKQAAAMKAYKETADPLSVLKEKYADLIPKKPVTAFWIFSQDPSERSKAEKALKDANEEAGHKRVTAKIGEIWKALKDSEKEVWNEKLKKATTEYEEKKKIWEARPEFAEYDRLEKEQKEQKAKEKAEEKEAAKEEKKAAKEAEKEEKKAAKEADKEGKKAAKEADKEAKKAAKASPKKAGKREAGNEDALTPSPPAKKAKVEKPAKAGKKAKAPELVIEADILKKAQGLGLESNLRNLMGRPEVAAKEFSHAKLLQALENNEGLVNKAKHVLLGA